MNDEFNVLHEPPNGNDGDSGGNKELSVYYRFGDREFEARGEAHQVNRHAVAFLAVAAPRRKSPKEITPPEGQLALFPPESDTPLLGQSNGASTEPSNNRLNGSNGHHMPQDLVSLYRGKSPKSQLEQILVITFHYQRNKGYQQVSYDNLKEAYTELLRVGANEPSNPPQVVKNAVDRKLLYKPNRGEGIFALTDQGKEHVERMGAES